MIDYEPLLPDHRLARIEGRLRREFPGLSEEAQFVTFIQPPTFTKSEGGVDMPIPAVAVFAVVEKNPRHPGYDEITPVNIWLSTWRSEDEANRHSSDVKADLAYRLYRLGVAAHCERMSNFRSMN